MDDRIERSQRTRFRLALGVFVLWLATLATLAVFSGYRPKAAARAAFNQAVVPDTCHV